MVARPESWSRRVDPQRAALVAVLAVAAFVASWALLHRGFYARDKIVDTPVYQRYGEAIADGRVPYRDFSVEYPPAALPVFVLPALVSSGGDAGEFRRAFEALMWLCGVALLGFAALALRAVQAGAGRAAATLAFVALAPLALGSVVLSRFDLWPAALTVAALTALISARERLGAGALGLATAAKLYPAVLLPLVVTYAWRRYGRREALVGLGVFLAVLAACFGPFFALAPGGVLDSLARQSSRPLQIESLGAAVLLAAHQVFDLGITMRSSHGSQNLSGTGPVAIAAVQTVLQAGALIAIWRWFARGPADRERLLQASAAAIAAFVALGRVLSPQFLIWLVPLVALLRERRGYAASALLAAALVLTQVWFPYRYWDLALRFDGVASWLVLARDLVLVGLLAAVAGPLRDRNPERLA